jgi:hypothetical protein
VIMVSLFALVKYPLISLPFLTTGIEVGSTPCPPNHYTHALSIPLRKFTSIPGRILIEDTIPAYPSRLMRLDDVGKTLSKGLVLEVLECLVRSGNNHTIHRLLTINRRNSVSSVRNLLCELGVYCRHLSVFDQFGGGDKFKDKLDRYTIISLDLSRDYYTIGQYRAYTESQRLLTSVVGDTSPLFTLRLYSDYVKQYLASNTLMQISLDTI